MGEEATTKRTLTSTKATPIHVFFPGWRFVAFQVAFHRDQNDSMSVLHLFVTAWQDFRRAWSRLLAVHVVYQLAAFALLTPLVGVALRVFVSFSGDTVVADQDILFFVLSPIGIVALVVLAAASIAIVAVEQAALMTIGFGTVRKQNVGLMDALWLAARHSESILRLTARLVIRVLLIASPFLAATAVVFLWLLSEFDINFYLSERPSEFWTAGVLIGAILLACAVVLVPRLVGWVYALPIHLFEEPRPSRAIAASEQQCQGHKRTVTLVLLGWAGASALVSTVTFGAVGAVARFVVPRVQGSIGLLVLVVGGVTVTLGAVNVMVTLFQSSFIALLIARLYDQLGSSETVSVPDAAGNRAAGLRLQFSSRTLLVGLVAAAALSGLVGYWLVDGVRMNDDVLVIAHRGAAGRAPENTLASVRAAIEDSADLVEIDVQETADGELVVIHDSDFMKIGGVNLKVRDASFAEARAIDIGSWFAPEFSAERIPTLTEVLELAKGAARVDIELKYYGHDERLEERVVTIVEAADMASDVVIMSLKRQGIQKVRELRPDWTIGLLTATAIGDLTRTDVDFLAVHSSLAVPRFINRAHAAGKDVYVWTVNDPAHMSRMVSRGVDGLITDEPALARQVLTERANLSSVERLLLEVAFFLGAVPAEPPATEDLE